MADKSEVLAGTLSLWYYPNVATMGPQHGVWTCETHRVRYKRAGMSSITARCIPQLLKLEQEGPLHRNGVFQNNNRRAKFLQPKPGTGAEQLERQTRDWQQTTAIVARFLSL